MSIRLIRRFPSLPALAVLLMPFAASAAAAAASDERVQQLYATAEYEQALALLGTANDPDAQMYRALCLLALGRHDETNTVVKSLVLTAPDFTASEEEVPPRFLSMLNEARRELVPGVLRSMFTEARAQYQGKAFDEAVKQFEKVLALSAPPDIRSLEGVSDLRVLSEGFLDLAKAAAPAAQPIVAAVAPAPQPVRTANLPVMTPPKVVKQDLPPWPATINNGIKNDGVVRVQISDTGRVISASIERSVNALYDLRLLAATRFWEYTPATRDGIPVPSESVVEVRLAR
jgi:TonB family protein